MKIQHNHNPRESKRIANKHGILNLVFRERSCSRLAMARRLNINASTIGKYVDAYLQEGILVEDHSGPTRRGRSPVPVWLNPDYGCFLGVDLEALRVRTVLTDFAGGILAQQEVGLRAGLGSEAVLRTVRAAAQEAARGGGARPMIAVGVAAPGRVDFRRGRIIRYELLPDFHDVPLLDHLRPHFDCPIYIEDNIRALTLAELLRGVGRGHRHFLCLAARSGIGLGIVIDGRIYTGSHALAGKVGWTAFPRDAHPQTMTDLVSAKGIVAQAIRIVKTARKTPLRRSLLELGDDLSLADLVGAADAGDRAMGHLLEQVGRDLGLLAANLANLFAPETIILAGEVPSCCALVRQTLEEWFRRWTLKEILEGTALVDGSLSGFAGAMGAAYLGFLKTFPEAAAAPEAGAPLVVGAHR